MNGLTCSTVYFSFKNSGKLGEEFQRGIIGRKARDCHFSLSHLIWTRIGISVQKSHGYEASPLSKVSHCAKSFLTKLSGKIIKLHLSYKTTPSNFIQQKQDLLKRSFLFECALLSGKIKSSCFDRFSFSFSFLKRKTC